MNLFPKMLILLGAGAALTACQSEEDRMKAQRETIVSTCLPRTQSSPAMQNVDAERFCNCLADGIQAAGSDGPPPDTAAMSERCEREAARLP
jgi:hypothetical protein